MTFGSFPTQEFHRVTFPSGTTNGIGTQQVRHISHINLLIIKDIATSTTFDCYFAQFFDGITVVQQVRLKLCWLEQLVIQSRVDFESCRSVPIYGFKWNNLHRQSEIINQNLKNVNSFRELMKDQIGKSLDGATFYLQSLTVRHQINLSLSSREAPI